MTRFLCTKKRRMVFCNAFYARGGSDGGHGRWGLNPRLPLAGLGYPVQQPHLLKNQGAGGRPSSSLLPAAASFPPPHHAFNAGMYYEKLNIMHAGPPSNFRAPHSIQCGKCITKTKHQTYRSVALLTRRACP